MLVCLFLLTVNFRVCYISLQQKVKVLERSVKNWKISNKLTHKLIRDVLPILRSAGSVDRKNWWRTSSSFPVWAGKIPRCLCLWPSPLKVFRRRTLERCRPMLLLQEVTFRVSKLLPFVWGDVSFWKFLKLKDRLITIRIFFVVLLNTQV